MKRALFIILLCACAVMSAFSYTPLFNENFQEAAFSELHLYLPLTPARDFHRLDPFPFKGYQLSEEVKRAFISKLKSDRKSSTIGEEELLYGLYSFQINPEVRGYLIRQAGEGSFFASSIELFIYNSKKREFTEQLSLAGYSHGESGGHFYQSWIIDTDGEGSLDIVTRERSGDWDELLSSSKDRITVKLWQNGHYLQSKPHNRKEALDSFRFYQNPFEKKPLLREIADSPQNEQLKHYLILMSSDSSRPSAQHELEKFRREFSYKNQKLHHLFRAPAEIAKKGNRYYTLLDCDLTRAEAEILLPEIRRVFPTAWVVEDSFLD